MIRLYRREGSASYYAMGRMGGRLVRKSLNTSRRDVAEILLKNLERDLAEGRAAAVTWPEFERQFTMWLWPHIKRNSQRKYEFVLTRFGKFLATALVASISQITPAHISAYMVARQQDRHPTKGIGVGPEGIKSDLRILRRTFSYAVECGYLESNPVRIPRLNTAPGSTQPFTRDEIRRMLEAAPHGNAHSATTMRAVVMTFVCTGLRISDVRALRWEAIDWQEKWVHVVTQKRGKPVSIPLHESLAIALREHVGDLTPIQRQSPLVFTTAQGKQMHNMDAVLRTMFNSAGVEKGRAHRFRDTFAVIMLEGGASLYDVSKLMGITVQVCERSYAPYVKDLRERGKRLLAAASFV
jgi:integrase